MNLPFFNKRTILILSVLFLILPGCQSDQTSGGGGSSPGTPTDQIVVINPNPPSGTYPVKVSTVPLPMPLFQSTSVVYYTSNRSFLFVLGGAYFDASSPTPNDPINVNTVYMTEISSNGALSSFWNVNPSAPRTSYWLPNIRGHSSVIYYNEIYVMGGIVSGVGFSDAILKSTISMQIDPNNGNQLMPVLGDWKYVGSLPVAETGMASVTNGSNLYVIGGIESGLPDFSTCILTGFCQGSQNTVYSNKIYSYSLPLLPIYCCNYPSHTTYTITSSLGMFTPATAIDDNANLWVLGGWGPDPTISGNPPNNLNQIFDFNVYSIGSSAQLLQSMPNGTGLSKAAAFYTTASGTGQIILIGGISGIQGTPDVIHQEIYSTSPSSLSPSNPNAWIRIGQIPQAITCFASSMDTQLSGMIYVIGGIDARDPSCISN